MQVEMKSVVNIDIELLAKLFSALDDDAQCRFFVEVAKCAEQWSSADPDYQWVTVGAHLRNCKCSTEAARNIISSIAYGMEHSTHGVEA